MSHIFNEVGAKFPNEIIKTIDDLAKGQIKIDMDKKYPDLYFPYVLRFKARELGGIWNAKKKIYEFDITSDKDIETFYITFKTVEIGDAILRMYGDGGMYGPKTMMPSGFESQHIMKTLKENGCMCRIAKTGQVNSFYSSSRSYKWVTCFGNGKLIKHLAKEKYDNNNMLQKYDVTTGEIPAMEKKRFIIKND